MGIVKSDFYIYYFDFLSILAFYDSIIEHYFKLRIFGRKLPPGNKIDSLSQFGYHSPAKKLSIFKLSNNCERECRYLSI